MSGTPLVAWAARSHVGRRREQNEDACFGEVRDASGALPPRGLFVVCDGMGGHARGEEASALAVEVLRAELDWALAGEWPDDSTLLRRVRDAVLAANRAVFEWNEQGDRTARERAGTTVVLLILCGARACLAHVGDSRAYRLSRGGFELLTADHNVANREIARGEGADTAWRRPDARHLTQAIGPRAEEHVRPDVRLLPLEEDTLFLLCSDGLSDREFVDRLGADILRPLLDGEADLRAGCHALIDAGNGANGHDNLTAVLVRVTGAAESAPRSRVPTTERIVLLEPPPATG